MVRYTQGKDGKFTGSVGSGKTTVPTPSSVPVAARTRTDAGEAVDYATMLDRMREATVIGAVPDRDGQTRTVRAGALLSREDSLALLSEGDWVGHQMQDSSGEMMQVWINQTSNAVMTLKDGRLHSMNGQPALVAPDGTRVWYQNGKIHNPDGPAVVFPDGTSRNYLFGRRQGKEPDRIAQVRSWVEPVASRLTGWLLA